MWAELNRDTTVHRLAVTGGTVSTTGSRVTRSGAASAGWGIHGLGADNLVSVELVDADGEVRTVTGESDPVLFWALRGGGGNFGVAVSLEYRLHPLREVYGGIVAHPFERARDVLRHSREFTQSGLPDELTADCAVVCAPGSSEVRLAAFVVCHAGSAE